MTPRRAVVLGVICAAVLVWAALISVVLITAHMAGSN